MARETYTLYAPPAPAGYQLTDGWVRDVETREGLYTTPERRGDDGDAGQGHGTLWVPKSFDVGGFVTKLWLLSSLSRKQVEGWYDELLRVAMWPYDLVRVVRGMADGTKRECLAELVTAVEPEPLGQLGMRIGLEWSVPAGFWQDTADLASVASANVASGSLLTFPELRGGTAPMDALQLTITGPVNGAIRLTQPLTREWVEVSGNLGAGQTVVLDCASGAIGGGVVTGDRVRYSGATYMELPPLPTSVPLQLQVTHAGGTSGASQVSLSGRRRWLA